MAAVGRVSHDRHNLSGGRRPRTTSVPCHAPGGHGPPRRRHVGSLSGHGRGLPHHGAGRQRHRRRRGHVLLPQPARAPEQRAGRRGADAHLLGARAAGLRAQRHGLVGAGFHHRLVPRARHRPNSRRRLSAGLRARRGRNVGRGLGPLWNPELRRGRAARHRAR